VILIHGFLVDFDDMVSYNAAGMLAYRYTRNPSGQWYRYDARGNNVLPVKSSITKQLEANYHIWLAEKIVE